MDPSESAKSLDGRLFNIWNNWFNPAGLPADPGGPLTAERIRVLRLRAAGASGYSTFAYDGAMIDVLDALEEERERLAAAEQEIAILHRVAREGLGWLVAEVDAGRAAEIQADRALVLCTDNLGRVPPVSCTPRRWWTNAEPPTAFDVARYNAACRVLARARLDVATH